jgi:hypothetical protein
VIPVKKKVDVDLLTQERDAIWTAAVLAYKSGEQWWLTPEEETLLAQANQGWQATDVWETAILKYLDDKSTCTITDLLEKPIGLELAKQSRSEQMRVSNILRRNGWVRVRKQIGNKREWFWEKVGQEVGQEVGQVSNPLPVKGLAESGNKVGQEVGQVSNPLPVTILDSAALPALPISQNLPKNQESDSLSVDPTSPTNTISEIFIKIWEKGRAGRAGRAGSDETDTEQGLESALPPASPAALPPNTPKVGQHHKEFEVGNRVVVTVEGLHKGAKGKITGKWYLGHTYTRYDIKLDKPSHSLTEIFVEIPIEAKRTYLVDANLPPLQR